MLRVHESGRVEFVFDGVIISRGGVIDFAGSWDAVANEYQGPVRTSAGVLMPPMLDIHTHIPQWPIRGRFVEGVPIDQPGGRLLEGLKRNVFPAEAKTISEAYTRELVSNFAADTLRHGVVGGCTYLTPFATAAQIALRELDPRWSVGLVMMNQNCPQNLRTDEETFEVDVEHLAGEFGRRLVVTDRFAVAVDTPLRRRGSEIARRLDLRTQTHLNEQVGEKGFVEQTLYPDYANYADVYAKDGLFDQPSIVAHCIEMTDSEWAILEDKGCAIAHCPTSNLLLGSNVMRLDEVMGRGIAVALATDVGASPTQSMLAEMRRFLQVHAAQFSTLATPTLAMFLATRAPAKIMGLDLGLFDSGRPASFIEVAPIRPVTRDMTSAVVIEALLPVDPDSPTQTVLCVTLDGVFRQF